MPGLDDRADKERIRIRVFVVPQHLIHDVPGSRGPLHAAPSHSASPIPGPPPMPRPPWHTHATASMPMPMPPRWPNAPAAEAAALAKPIRHAQVPPQPGPMPPAAHARQPDIRHHHRRHAGSSRPSRRMPLPPMPDHRQAAPSRPIPGVPSPPQRRASARNHPPCSVKLVVGIILLSCPWWKRDSL